MKDKFELENQLTGATEEYSYENQDADFNVLAVISCEDGLSDVHIIENDEIDGCILSAIRQVCKTDDPEKFAAMNQTAFKVARIAVALALSQKGGK